MTNISRQAFVDGLVREHGVKRADAERAADRTFGSPSTVTPQSVPAALLDTSAVRVIAEQQDPALSVTLRARRAGDALWMELVSTPQTKKNHAASLGSGKSKAYKRFLADVVEAVAQVKDALLLPLPDRRPLGYNCCAHFFVDRLGERADVVGLQQGLNDALEAAGVVSDDWVFRQADGTRVILGSRPRVALWITPITEVSLDTPEIP